MREPLVLLPGFMCDMRVFAHQITVFSLDRSVHLTPVTSGGSIAAMARMALDGAPKRFALAGQGLGAMVAMDMLRQAPERVTRLALIGTSPLAETPQEAAVRDPRIAAARAGRLDEMICEDVPPGSLAPGPRRVEIATEMVDMARMLGPEVYGAQSRALQRRPDQQKTLRTTRIPTLVMCGAHDTIYPPRRHEFMAELIPNADLSVLENAGHLPLLETPADVTAALHDWLGVPYLLT